MKYICKGATHIHTKYSDGTGTIEQIAACAKKAGLSWIVITDHNTLAGLKNDEEGFINDIAVIIGEEISPDYSDHYLAFDIKSVINHEKPPELFIDEVNKQGGFGFIAHPDESTSRKNSYKPLRWNNWDADNFQGIEIWNYLSDWTDNFDEEKKLFSYFFRHKLIKGPTSNVLSWWDKINNKNPNVFPAIGSLDVHAFNFKFLKIFPYFDSFKTITNHLLLEEELSKDFSKAKKQILTAIKGGNNVIIDRTWGELPKSNGFYITNNSDCAYAGEKIKLTESASLYINLPKKSNIRVIHNGSVVMNIKETRQTKLNKLKPGKYRFEAYYKNYPWIFSNPIICY